ncbi:MAG TPA: CBS domain-containing protein [Nitrosopumilaceae archaeon]|nr:CBS domain-containing protein [Nitrosopumilaceae archaeon]
MSENQNLILNRKDTGRYLMKIKLYSAPVISLKENATIDSVLLKMQLNNIRTVLITSEKKPRGIVTETDIVKFLEDDKTNRALDEIPVTEIMKEKVISITDEQQDHLNQCSQRMEIFKIGSIIITDEDGVARGITTKTDITSAFSVMYRGKCKVKEYMSKNVVTCRKSDSIQYALNMINKNGISRLIVTDQFGNPTGLITRNTFLRYANNIKKSSKKALDYWNPTDLDIALPIEKLLDQDVLVLNLEDDLAEAAKLMVKNLVGGIPVINNERKLVGIVTKSDVVRAFSEVESNSQLLEKYKQTH